MRTRHILAAALTAALAAAVGAPSAAIAVAPTAKAHAAATRTVSAKHLLAALPVRAESHSASYRTSKFPLWIDANRDGENTRTEVLKATSRKQVAENKNGSVKTGSWVSAYDGKVYTSASKLGIAHIVPLEEAWTSGAYKWSTEKRTAFANDIGYRASLIIVAKHVSRPKTHRETPATLPRKTTGRCAYVRNYIAVKSRWGLSANATEKTMLKRDLEKYCSTVSVAKPGKPSVAKLAGTSKHTAGATSGSSKSPSSTPAAPTSSPGATAAPAPVATRTPAPASAPAVTTAPAVTSSCSAPARSVGALAGLFPAGQSMAGRSFVIGGLGSSVGVGATLQDPADAPVAYFASQLEQKVDPAGLARWTTVNGSVNGSTIHNGRNRDWAALEKSHPSVVVLAYGMNDGMPSQFNAGETYDGAMKDLCALITDIRESGALPVMLTTPSPHTTRTDWNYLSGTSTPQHASIDTSKPVRDVVVPGVGVAPESTRHAAVNEGFRWVANLLHVDLIDVEPYWLNAVASRGQDALFNVSQTVHPNLLGHQLSYHAAIDARIQQLR
jgi:lysophospholipase L1-like esterase